MMTWRRGHSGLRVGILSIIGALLFAGLFLQSTNRVLGAHRSTIFVRLSRADGLQRGDAVLHRGVGVGEVKGIEFGEGDVIVRIRLTREVPVGADACAAMVAADLFGRQAIVIREGGPRARPLTNGDTLAGTGPVTMTARLEGLGERVNDLLSAHTVDRVHAVLDGADSAATSAAQAVSEIGSLARTAEAVIGEQRLALRDVTREAAALARNVREFANPDDMAALRDGLQTSASNLASATETMDSAAVRLARILAGLEAGRGSAGRMLTDEELYERATGSLAALERLLADVRANPGR